MGHNDVAPLLVNALFRTLPAGRAKRWDLLKAFFMGWYGELTPTDGCTPESIRVAEERLQLTLPAALREWYLLAGRRKPVWSCQDHFLEPEDLRIENDKLLIYVECQAVVKWGIPLSLLVQDDPPIFVSDQCNSASWIEEAPATVFALSQMLLGVKFSDSTFFSANGQATDGALDAVARGYQRLDFPDLNWPPYPTRLYGGLELVIETDAETWIWVSGRSLATFRPALELITGNGVTWEQVIGI